ncbi:Glutamate receptor ionotropic, kainate 4 [Acipenser ruthenus]|uniref:Glutamate receptor ionotropic, kainate 4 n=1 Tax=Acipenser ruthenus TaxID=7906 RepID=A0A444V1J7_ACIRT|nr:Glutamate receptor ionotropic, kainate 4 [Acipenser ruthenus]
MQISVHPALNLLSPGTDEEVAPDDILKVQFQRFTTLNMRPTNTDISMAVTGLLKFFNSTTSCLICAKAECLLNLERLLRQFLISKDTLSVRMLDDSQDPTPLLKEIRDDKTATIIVDANATISHIILERASELGMLSFYYTYIFTSLHFLLCHVTFRLLPVFNDPIWDQEVGPYYLSHMKDVNRERKPITGLLNLERLLRQFLISKDTLSVRMLDDSQDPTPLLKEIRDDKTATIIVDANATISHIILERVAMTREHPGEAP